MVFYSGLEYSYTTIAYNNNVLKYNYCQNRRYYSIINSPNLLL